ncbi:MAG: Asp-tRNA(Asn)/Glu-tRNA(Gln) amidotransferase subunit GatC [Desulfovibrionaceae bacterium]|nr:Asp-tRNA(Asn)/Glu-tRNA(Gln) amidotransferase subunit GatC [Desulfovibrionaceae bacterium]
MSQKNDISTAEVAKMARLARLDVPAERQELFARQFGDILSYMDILAQVDTAGVEPLYSPVLHASNPRPDAAENRRERAEVLGNAPEQDGQYFIVPRIV